MPCEINPVDLFRTSLAGDFTTRSTKCWCQGKGYIVLISSLEFFSRVYRVVRLHCITTRIGLLNVLGVVSSRSWRGCDTMYR